MSDFDCSDEAVGRRMLAIRQARKETIAALALAIRADLKIRIDTSKLHRMEHGKQVSLLDIAIIAAMDPARRGREWLAFGVRESRAETRVADVHYEEGIPPNALASRRLQVAEAGQPYRVTAGAAGQSTPVPKVRKRRGPK